MPPAPTVSASLSRPNHSLTVVEYLIFELCEGDLVFGAAGGGAGAAGLLKGGGQGGGGGQVLLLVPDERVAGPCPRQALLHVPKLEFIKTN